MSADNNNSNPIQNKEEVKNNPDPHIAQDFENFPHAPGSKKQIDPKSNSDKNAADLDEKDGDKMTKKEKKEAQETNEQDSDGSGGAFEGTERATDNDIKNNDAKTVSD